MGINEVTPGQVLRAETRRSVSQATGGNSRTHQMALGTQPCRASASKASDSRQRELLPASSKGWLRQGCREPPLPAFPLPGRLPPSPGKQDSSRPDLLVSSWNHPRCRPWSHLPTCLGAGEGNSLGWAERAARPICLGICLLSPPFPCSFLPSPSIPSTCTGRSSVPVTLLEITQGNDTTEPVPRAGINQGDEAGVPSEGPSQPRLLPCPRKRAVSI